MPPRGGLGDPRPRLLALPGLEGISGLKAALSTREGGVSAPPLEQLNLGRSVGDAPRAVRANRWAVARQLGFEAPRFGRQVHGTTVLRPRAPSGPLAAGDALLLDRPGILGGVLGADCTLSLLVDPQVRVLVLVHAGWKGLAAGMAKRCLAALLARTGRSAQGVTAVLASSICSNCYEVGPEVVAALKGSLAACGASPNGLFPRAASGQHCADLRGVLHRQWEALGIPARQMHTLAGCTREQATQFYSHRRDGTRSGRHALLAGWLQ